MNAREHSQRLKRFEAAEKARKVADLAYMIREFEQMAADLDRQVQSEEERTGIKDIAHFSYSTLAKAAAQRRDNLKASVADLQVKHDNAVRERDEAAADLARAVGPEPRDTDRMARSMDRGLAVGAR
jgi:flagellar protein FliJ